MSSDSHEILPRRQPAVASGSAEPVAADLPTVTSGPVDSEPQQGSALPPESPTVPGYEILEVLGRGGMGVVYKARHISLNRIVALKMILAGSHAEESQRARFRTEAEAVASLRHPNIVQIHEVGEHEGNPYFSLEFIAGGILADRLDGAPLSAAQAAGLVETLAHGMAHAHELGIIHRDLKPANVLLSLSREPPASAGPALAGGERLNEAVPKITDFGLAKRLDSDAGQTQSGAILGTPSYMAPEQAEGKSATIGPAADLYALGAILYELLTGRPPFKATTPLDTLLQVVSDEPVPPRRLQSKVPRDLETICLKCLHKALRQRYANARALVEDLRRFRAGEPIQARPVSMLERSLKWARRRPAAAALLAVTAVAALGLLAVWVWFTAQLRAENDRALKNEAEAIAQKEEADRQRDQARENLRLARAAVDEYCSEVGQSEELQALGLEKLRQRLLTTPVRFYKEFVRQLSSDPAVLLEQGKAMARLADLAAETGSPEEAVVLHEQAAVIFERLARLDPSRAEYRKALFSSVHNVGNSYRDLAQPDKAEATYLRAFRLSQELTQDGPNDPAAAVMLAACQGSLGRLYSETQRLAEAEAAYEKTLELCREITKTIGTSPANQTLEGTAWNDLGQLYAKTNRADKAEAAYRESLRIRDEVLRADPRIVDSDSELADVCINLAVLYQDTRRSTQAEPYLNKALGIYAKLVEQHPHVALFRQHLAVAYVNLGSLLTSLDKRDQAEVAYRTALDLVARLTREQPQVAYNWNLLSQVYHNLAVTYADTGQEGEAEASYQKVVEIRAELVRHYPAVTAHQESLAEGYYDLAKFQGDAGRSDKAVVTCRKALATIEPLLHTHADAPNYLYKQAEIHSLLGEIYETMHQPAQAAEERHQALAILRRLAKQPSSTVMVTVLLGGCCCNLGNAARAAGDLPKALDWYDQASAALKEALRREPSQAKALEFLHHTELGRAFAQSALGRHVEAAAFAETLAKRKPAADGNLYDAACVYAACSAGVR
jgi:tetratricopeptide (TPR) repeat protein/tRNA A-37 threonylcarbamoyl transferase component Bud32